MPVFNTQGLPIQLVVQPDKNFTDLAAGLQPGQVLRGRVSEVLADGKAVVNFRGVNVTAELKGVSLARGEVISVAVKDLKGQPVMRLLPQASAQVAPQAAPVAVPSAPAMDAAIAAVLSNLGLPRDGFHAAVVQLLQAYSVPPSREAVASVKELLASLPAFLETPVSPASPPAVPVQSASLAGGTGKPVQQAPAVQSAPVPAPVLAETTTGTPVRVSLPSVPAWDPPLPDPAINAALSRGYNLGRLLAALDAERIQAPASAPAPASASASASAPVPVPASAPIQIPVNIATAPAEPVATQPAGSVPATVLPANATVVANVLADALSANAPAPLPAILDDAIKAMQSVVAGSKELPGEVRQGLQDIARDLSALMQSGSREPVRDLGAIAGRLNGIIRAMPGGEAGQPAPLSVPTVGSATPSAIGMPAFRPIPLPVRSAAELAGALAGIIHEEVAQAVQPQVAVVASAAMVTQVSAETTGLQTRPSMRPDANRTGNPMPLQDSETGSASPEAPRSVAPAPVILPQAVREPEVPVDVPRIMAIVAEISQAVSVPAKSVNAAQTENAVIPSILPPPTPAQSQVISGAVVMVDSRSEALASALTRGSGGVPVSLPVPRPDAQPVRDPRVGFMPPAPSAIPAREVSGLYGATAAGGPRVQPAENIPASMPAVSPGRAEPARPAPATPATQVSIQPSAGQVGRDVVETAVFMHAFALPSSREVARASHEYLFGQPRLGEALQAFENAVAAAGTRNLPAPVREAVQAALQAVREIRVTMEGDEVSSSRLQGAVEKMGLDHESKIARAAGRSEDPKPTQQAVIQEIKGVRDTLKSTFIGLRERVEAALPAAQNQSTREVLGALRSSSDDVLQVVQAQQVGSISRSEATQVAYVQLPIAAGNEMRGGEVHLSWKKEGEGKNRRRDPRAPALMNLNMETRALGPVKVRMQLIGQNLSLVFQVNDPAIQSFLSGEFSGLKNRLEGFALRVDRLVAEVAPDEAVDEGPRAISPTSTVDFRA